MGPQRTARFIDLCLRQPELMGTIIGLVIAAALAFILFAPILIVGT